MLPSYEELTAARNVIADGIWNMRDLGGLPRHDGGVIPRGLFWLRSRYGDIVSYLTRIGISGAEVAALRHALTTAA